MADQRELVCFSESKPCKVHKLKVGQGSNITLGQVLLQYEFDSVENNDTAQINNGHSNNKQHVIRATIAGTVEKVFVKEGDPLTKGYSLYSNKMNHK